MSELSILDIDPEGSPVHVWYVDHDPKVAAQQIPDALLWRAAIDAAKVLSTVWAHKAEGQDCYEAGFYPNTPECIPYTPPECLQTLVVKLYGQRIYYPLDIGGRHWQAAALVEWAGASRANYKWLVEHAFWIVQTHGTALGKPHGVFPALWALEWAPDALDSATAQSEPPVVVRTRQTVVEGGEEYLDALASYRTYLLKHRAHALRWTKRPQPEWSHGYANHQVSS
jgi:hypothetical protein